MKKVLALGVVLVGGALGARGVRHAGAEPAPDLAARVREWIVQAYRNQSGVVPGMARKGALEAGRAAASLSGDFVLSLAGTPYEPKPWIPGSMRYFLGSRDEAVSSVQLVITVPAYDRAAMAAAVVAAGKDVGLSLESSEDSPHTYFDHEAKGRDLWVALGDGVIAVDLDAVKD